MAMPASKLEAPVEERIARLETHVEHIQSDVTEIKGHLQRLDQKIDSVKDSLEAKIDNLRDSIFELNLSMEKRFSRLTFVGFTLYITLAGGLLAAMAKGFGWIG
jgi:hypothetical protein